MQDHRTYRRVMCRAALAAILAGGVTACADLQDPAPVFMKTGAAAASAPTAPIRREQHRIAVQSGQTVNGVAHDYRVTPAAIIAANKLQPPYELKAGQRLIIPDIGPTQLATAPAALQPAMVSPPPIPQPPKPVATSPPQSPWSAPTSALPPQTIFPQPAAGQPGATPPQPSATPSPSSPAKGLPEIIPLDGPAPAKAAASDVAPPPKLAAGETSSANVTPLKPASASVTPNAATPAKSTETTPLKPTEVVSASAVPAKPVAAEPPPKQAAAALPATASGAPPVLAPRNPAAALPLPGEEPAPLISATSSRFAWPVYGRILTTYGASANGTRNDGINIAAARGTPVHSIDSGTVAYVGNEVKGYGNLLLIKHENGFISAYAHLEEPAVKIGDKIRSGQVIAKVGETGGVKQPQLHFELRRGQKAVDPREFLPPTPSAGGPEGNKSG